MKILGIETSCDETAAAVLEDRTVLSNVILSQAAEHGPFGGVVPELASRRHVETIEAVVSRALDQARSRARELDLIAVTAGPGLPGALIVGFAFAKSLAWAIGRPLYPINHLEGHIAAARLDIPDLSYPFLALLVSGGHTELVWVNGPGDCDVLGRTLDDAAGEAFDKVGTLLGLAYPAGREVEMLAKGADAGRFEFPRPMSKRKGLDFSFSGLKTAVAVRLARMSQEEKASARADLAAGFQEAAVDTLVSKVQAGVDRLRPERVVLCGGVAANGRLREKVRMAMAGGPAVHVPSLPLCSDNAAMIAYAAFERYRGGVASPILSEPRPDWELESR